MFAGISYFILEMCEYCNVVTLCWKSHFLFFDGNLNSLCLTSDPRVPIPDTKCALGPASLLGER